MKNRESLMTGLLILGILSLLSWAGFLAAFIIQSRRRKDGQKARWWFPITLIVFFLLSPSLSICAIIVSLTA